MKNPIDWIRAPTTVRVENRVEGGAELKLHCKSKDDDLGVRVLGTRDQFVFRFRPNLWGTTLFYCSMNWGEGQVHWFDIYIFYRDYRRCSNCQWVIRKNGPCYYDAGTREFDICYQWNR
ncbi:unnamed protein product [Linum trigynum]|uniref:S-protein homolog n=1 Tax=Linum trigynum TaxID=586398 RepID=A0AAV2EES9_9ROSI